MPLVFLFVLGGVNVAHAVGSNSTNGEWEYSLAPLFLWAQGIDGTSTIGPNAAPLDVEFKDALSNLEAAFTVRFEAKRDALTLFGEYQYVDLGPTADGPGPTTLDVSFKNTISELGAAYWVYGTGKTDWEVIGGARYTKQELSVAIKNGPKLPGSVNESWWVGFLGGRVSAEISQNWTFIARADYGLGSGDTNRIWHLAAMFDYRFRDWGSVFVGWKHLDYDYDNGKKGLDRYAYDASQTGPLLGLNIHW
jgi:hypothetical protein